MSRAAHTVVILMSRLSCFLTHRKELVLATPRPWGRWDREVLPLQWGM